MSALKGIFEDWREGEEYDIEDQEKWTLLNIGRGNFVELSLGWTDWSPPSDATVGFLIMGHTVTGDGGMALRAHYVGSPCRRDCRVSSTGKKGLSICA